MERVLQADAAVMAPSVSGSGRAESTPKPPAFADGSMVAMPAVSTQRHAQESQAQHQQQQELQLQQQQQQLWLEQQRIREMIRQEMQASARPMQASACPMQIIVNNHSEANSQQRTMNVQPPANPERKEVPQGPKPLEISQFSRFCIFSAVGLGLYVLHGQWQHQWRMAEMQRRIDANLFLRITQLFAGPAPR